MTNASNSPLQEAKTVRLSLPFPPSANAIWRAYRGRNIASAPYRAWKLEAGMALNVARPGRIAGPYEIHLRYDRPDRRWRDAFNYEKAVSDLLVSSGVVEDDRLAQRGVVEWSDRPPGKGAQVHVTISPWGGE